MADTSQDTGTSIEALASSLLVNPATDTHQEGEQVEQSATDAPETEQSDEGESEQSESTEAQQQADQPRKVTVKIGDKTEEVDEAELVKGYTRQSDYTRKSQEVAEQRKALEAEKAAIAALRQQEIAQLTEALEWARGKLPQAPEYDPNNQAGYLDAKVKYDAEMAAYHKAVEAARTRHAELSRQQEEQQRALVAEESKRLIEAIPEWKDEAKRKAGNKELGEFLGGLGFGADDLAGITDHRVVVLARKAMLYDRLQASKAEVEKKVVNVPRVMKPGATSQSTVSDDTRALQRLAKTGSVDDAAAYLLTRRK